MKEVMPSFDRRHSFGPKAASVSIPYRLRRQTGAVAIMSAFVLLVILGFIALALDMSRIYNRRVELHTVADTAALSAAKYLDGTEQGIRAALLAAKQAVEDPANGPRYAYVNHLTWADAAISFSASPYDSTGWKPDSQALASPAGLMYVKVDTAVLDQDYGRVRMFFAPVLSLSLDAVDVSHTAIAGKSRLNVTPLGICAMSSIARSKRVSDSGTAYDELVEYGFRRGVGYNLLNLNPGGTSPVHYQIDPVSAPDNSSASNFESPIFTPFVCSGTMAIPSVTGASVAVKSGFPIGTYATSLNSRFDPYGGTCNIHTSPPDSNVRSYAFGVTNWMTPKSNMQSAKTDPAATTKLQTVADAGPPNHTTAADYGALWSFARAVPWSSDMPAGAPEPPEGYATFAATSVVWKALYGSDSGVGTYPATGTPYYSTAAAYIQIPPTIARRPGAARRRILNIPLLSCPISGTTANVLAIGKFLMTVPADATSIHAEFGGITPDDRLGGLVEIYQ